MFCMMVIIMAIQIKTEFIMANMLMRNEYIKENEILKCTEILESILKSENRIPFDVKCHVDYDTIRSVLSSYPHEFTRCFDMYYPVICADLHQFMTGYPQYVIDAMDRALYEFEKYRNDEEHGRRMRTMYLFDMCMH